MKSLALGPLLILALTACGIFESDVEVVTEQEEAVTAQALAATSAVKPVIITTAQATEGPPDSTAGEAPQMSPAETASPDPAITPTAATLSFEALTYTDENAGFSLQYPDGWMVDASLGGGDRGYVVQLTSWEHEPGEFENPPGDGTLLALVVVSWDPQGDLDAYADHYRQVWTQSELTILDEQAWTLEDGQPAARFILEGFSGEESFYVLTAVADRYLQMSGFGDLELLTEISRSVRILD